MTQEDDDKAAADEEAPAPSPNQTKLSVDEEEFLATHEQEVEEGPL